MKIIHVLTTSKVSGAEKVAIDIINESKKNYEVYYCCPTGDVLEILKKNHINMLPLTNFSYFNLKKYIEKINPDIIHAHDFSASVLCSFFSKKIKVISHIHHTPDWYKKRNFKTFLYRSRVKKFTKILTVSDDTLNEFPFSKKLLADKIMNIGNPINPPKIISASNTFEQKERFNIIFLGRLAPEKNPLLFIEVIKKISDQYTDLKVCIVGQGELKSEVEKKINEYKINNIITMVGFVENPYPYIKASDIFVSTSEREGFGLAIVESLILETPVVAFNIEGVNRFVTKDIGFLVNNKNEMEEKILSLLKNESALIEKSLNCGNLKYKYNNFEKYKKLIESVYKN